MVVLALLSALAAGAPAAGEDPVGSPTGPSVLLLVSDDQGFTTWDRSLMPEVFGRLVDEGVTFDRAYDTTSLCCPSRSELMTGLYEHHTGVDENSVTLDRPDLVQALHDMGYRTALAGKYLNSESCEPVAWFDDWTCTSVPPSDYSYVNPYVNENGTWVPETGYTTDILAGRLASFIASTPLDQPFFAMFTPTSPHLPANDPRCADLPVLPSRPPSWDEDTPSSGKPEYTWHLPLSPSQVAYYDGNHQRMTQAVRCLDGSMATVLDSLGDRDQDTLVVYLSDNGFLYGEHRRSGKGVPYVEAVHVPFVVRYPPLVPPEAPFTSEAIVENVDIAATIADLAGIPWGGDGISFRPVLEGGVGVRTVALIEGRQGESYPRLFDPLPYSQSDPPSYAGVVSDRYAYVEYLTGERELYDLTADPYQLTNLAGAEGYEEVEAHLSAEMQALRDPAVETTIVTGPAGLLDARIATFTFFSQSRLATYECRVDSNGRIGTWHPCPAPGITEGPLADGEHTFMVRGMDELGARDATPATRALSIVSTGPPVTITDAPPVEARRRETRFRFTGEGIDLTFECRNALLGSETGWEACDPAVGVAYGPLDDGQYLFEVRATDPFGETTDPPAPWLYEVDNAGPNMSFPVAPAPESNQLSATLRFQPDEPTNGVVTCSLDGGQETDCSGGLFVADGLAEGDHDLAVAASDRLGNRGETSFGWRVDLTPPVLTIDGTPADGAVTNDPSASFSIGSSEPTRGMGCMFDGLGLALAECEANRLIRLEDLADGVHTFGASAGDAAGNASIEVVRTWTVDTVPPAVTITAGPPPVTRQTRARFTFEASDATMVRFRCTLDDGPDRSCQSAQSYRNLALGDHAFTVEGVDEAGNVGTPASWSWVIVATGPSSPTHAASRLAR